MERTSPAKWTQSYVPNHYNKQGTGDHFYRKAPMSHTGRFGWCFGLRRLATKHFLVTAGEETGQHANPYCIDTHTRKQTKKQASKETSKNASEGANIQPNVGDVTQLASVPASPTLKTFRSKINHTNPFTHPCTIRPPKPTSIQKSSLQMSCIETATKPSQEGIQENQQQQTKSIVTGRARKTGVNSPNALYRSTSVSPTSSLSKCLCPRSSSPWPSMKKKKKNRKGKTVVEVLSNSRWYVPFSQILAAVHYTKNNDDDDDGHNNDKNNRSCNNNNNRTCNSSNNIR